MKSTHFTEESFMDELVFVGRGGREFSWRDVMSHLRRRTFKRYGRTVDDEVLEEALSSAYLDLVDYYQGLESAATADGRLQFGYALYRASHVINREIARQVALHNRERRSGTGWTSDDGEDGWADVPSLDDGPEAIVAESDLARRARLMLAEADPEVVKEWFDVLLDGGTEREIADRLGISPATAHRRRDRARKAIRELAPAFGLVS